MYKKIKIADIPIEINTLYDSLSHSTAYETDEAPAFTISINERDIADERKKSVSECAYEGIKYPDYSPAELENTAVYRKIAMKLPEYDGIVFHGSAVAVDGKAYLFTAKSGTGKTTHTNLWLKNIEGSYIVNGDKPVLRFINGRIFVCGTPWMGKEGCGCNTIVPLAAICLLNRCEYNSVFLTSFKNTYHRLIGQCYRPPNGALLAKTIKLLERIGNCVRIYELNCNMEDDAAMVAFEGMTTEVL